MVYRGPSQGCLVCRERRVKCDLEIPACRNCRKRGVQCPGPKDAFDKMLRDQTSTLQRQGSDKEPTGRAPRQRDAVSGILCKRTRAIGNKSADLSKTMVARTSRDWPSTTIGALNSGPRVDLEYEGLFTRLTVFRMANQVDLPGLCFLFSTMTTSDKATSGVGFIEHLMPLYFESPPNSPLSLATSAVATNVLSQRKYNKADPLISRSFYARSVVQTQAAILDPELSQSDALLATVLMLDFYETLVALFNQSNPSHSHYEGAVALVNHRKAKNYANERARLLLMAVRMRMLSAPPSKHQGPSIGLLHEEAPIMSTDSAAEFDRLRARVEELISYAGQLLKDDGTQFKISWINSLSYQAIKLNAELRAWERGLPGSWTPQTMPAVHALQSDETSGAADVQIELYSHAQMSNVVNSCRRMRIAVLEIAKKCNTAIVENNEPCMDFIVNFDNELKTLRLSLLNSPGNPNPDKASWELDSSGERNAAPHEQSGLLDSGIWPELSALSQEPLNRTWADGCCR